MGATSTSVEGLVQMHDAGVAVTRRQPIRLPSGDLGPVNAQARWLVSIAAGISLLAAIWVSKAEAGGVVPYAIYAFLIATPLLARDARTFVRACRLGAVAMALLGLLGFAYGLFYFWPAAGLLLAASHAAVSHGRETRLLMTIGALVGILAGICWGAAIYQTALRPADSYRVTFESQEAAKSAAGTSTASLETAIGLGTTTISLKDRAWNVSFRSDLTAAQKSLLVDRLRQLPGVSRVGLCSRWKGEC